MGGLQYKKAVEILREELEEQILNDGGHFELSPMYHQIMLFRVLDCINLIENNLKWINWVERSGVRLFQLLRENSFLFSLFFPLYQRFYNRTYAHQIEKYSLGTFVSGFKAEQDFLKKGVSKNKIKHLYYALEPLEKSELIPNELNNSKFKYHFIYVGALSQRKGIDVLLKAFSKIDQNEWGLILVGKDTMNGKYQDLAKKLKIQDKVQFTGAVEFTKVNEFMSFADVFILPTRFDGWGAVLNEAASLEMPIISTDECGAAYHLIQHDSNGYRVKTDSIKDLSNAMKIYLDTPENISKHGQVSLELFKHFLPMKNVKRLVAALEEWS